jgi:integration host factor subunit beta
MLKSGLVRRLAEQNPHLHLKDAQKIVDAIFDEVTAALARGDRIELRGFGAFFLRTRSARPESTQWDIGQRAGEASPGFQDW